MPLFSQFYLVLPINFKLTFMVLSSFKTTTSCSLSIEFLKTSQCSIQGSIPMDPHDTNKAATCGSWMLPSTAMLFFLVLLLSGWSPFISVQSVSAHPLRCSTGLTSFVKPFRFSELALISSSREPRYHRVTLLVLTTFCRASQLFEPRVFPSSPEGTRRVSSILTTLAERCLLQGVVLITDFIYGQNPGGVPRK